MCEEEARKARFSLSFVLLLFLLFRRGKKRTGKKRKGREEALVSVSALLFGDWPRDCVAKNAAAGKKKKRKETHIVAYCTTGNDLFSSSESDGRNGYRTRGKIAARDGRLLVIFVLFIRYNFFLNYGGWEI